MKKITATTILFFCFLSNCNADEWVTNWIDQSTVSTPGTFQTERRGYVTTSNVSMRYKQDNDHLVSFSPPSFKKGCGGIDMFFGSMNYLNADRLMAKFERIMEGALATYAFDLALNVLCTSCAKELQTLESLMDRLNGIQMDDCKATKAVVAVMNDKTGQGESSENSEAMSDFMISSGISDLYNDTTDTSNNESSSDVMSSNGFSKSDMVSGCPSELSDIYFTSGTLFDNVANVKGIDTSHVKLMRGLVGDVMISGDLDYAVVGACSENIPISLDKIVYGEIYSREGDSDCAIAGDITIDGTNYTSLSNWAELNVRSIVDALDADTSFTTENVTFLNSVPRPLYTQLVNDVSSYGDELDDPAKANIVGKYIRSTSVSYAYNMFSSLLAESMAHLNTASAASVNQTDNNTDCNTALKSKAESHAKSMLNSAYEISGDFRTEYNSIYLEEMAALMRADSLKTVTQKSN